MHYIAAALGAVLGLWFVLAALGPTTALRFAAIRMTSTGSRIGAAVVGLVLLVFSSIGFLPR